MTGGVTLPNIEEVRAASARIKPWVHRTPVLASSSINALSGASLWFKCENLQKTGSFKIRGATNAVSQLSQTDAEAGVITHSSGNHGAALALAARNRNIPAYIVMPENAAAAKVRAVRAYGGKVFPSAATLASRETTMRQIQEETRAIFIPPYDHQAVIAGQGTVALELLEEVPDLDAVVVPVGGGGLLSGTALVVRSAGLSTQAWGAEPEVANDAFLSLQHNCRMAVQSVETIADGLRTSLGETPFAIIRKHVPQVLTVSETEIIQAMRLLWERMKLVVEPSGAVPLGAVLAHPEQVKGRRLGIILSGGNVDLERLPWSSRE